MYAACSTTARRGALDWAPEFEKANRPVFERLYKSVRDGTETKKSLEFNSRSTYRQDLAKELKEIDEQEIWRAGKSSLLCSSDWILIGIRMKARPFALSARTTGSKCIRRYYIVKNEYPNEDWKKDVTSTKFLSNFSSYE